MGVDPSGINLALFPADQVNMLGAAHIWNCRNCGRQYYNKRHGFNGEGEQYCSKACAYSHRHGIDSPNHTTKSMGPLLTLYYKPCEWCGVLLTGPLKPRRFCSREHYRLVKNRDDYQVNSHRKILKARPCLYCNKLFIPEYGNKKRLICSAHCFKKYSNLQHASESHKERAERFGVAYEPVNSLHVFQRDKWHCRLCGIHTPKRLRGKHLAQSPELDHIVPMSRGGPHTYDNTQGVCRSCNAGKSDRTKGQLWLSGTAKPTKRNKSIG